MGKWRTGDCIYFLYISTIFSTPACWIPNQLLSFHVLLRWKVHAKPGKEYHLLKWWRGGKVIKVTPEWMSLFVFCITAMIDYFPRVSMIILISRQASWQWLGLSPLNHVITTSTSLAAWLFWTVRNNWVMAAATAWRHASLSSLMRCGAMETKRNCACWSTSCPVLWTLLIKLMKMNVNTTTVIVFCKNKRIKISIMFL